jgi:catechol 2,3-dioxygenase-like lactoylglutathione lyase family enzyme
MQRLQAFDGLHAGIVKGPPAHAGPSCCEGYTFRMRRHLQGLDHVVIAVADLDAAQAGYARMGFTLAPRGHHSIGSSNHCIMLGADYIELLASPVERPHPWRQFYTDHLRAGEGLAGIALATDDAKRLYSDMLWAGFSPADALELSRPVDFHGDAREARFCLTQLDPTRTLGVSVFACEHRTRELVWRPEWQQHANGARALAAIAMLVDDVAAAAKVYARIFDTRPVEIDEGLLVNTGTAPIAFMDAAALATRLPGVALGAHRAPTAAALFVHVADRDAAERALRTGGMRPQRMPDGSIAVGADRAHGVALVFG